MAEKTSHQEEGKKLNRPDRQVQDRETILRRAMNMDHGPMYVNPADLEPEIYFYKWFVDHGNNIQSKLDLGYEYTTRPDGSIYEIKGSSIFGSTKASQFFLKIPHELRNYIRSHTIGKRIEENRAAVAPIDDRDSNVSLSAEDLEFIRELKKHRQSIN